MSVPKTISSTHSHYRNKLSNRHNWYSFKLDSMSQYRNPTHKLIFHTHCGVLSELMCHWSLYSVKNFNLMRGATSFPERSLRGREKIPTFFISLHPSATEYTPFKQKLQAHVEPIETIWSVPRGNERGIDTASCLANCTTPVPPLATMLSLSSR